MFLLILFILFCYILFLSILDSRKIQRQNSDREQHWPPYAPSESPEIPIDLSDPNASPEMLLVVGNSSLNHAILRLVASNPNTPSELLLRLFLDFPNEVRSNPIFSRLVLRGHEDFKQALAESCLNDTEYLPIEILESLINNSPINIQIFIVRHPRTTNALLDKLLSPKNKELQYKLAKENSYSYYRRNHVPLADQVVLRLAHNQVPNIADRIAIRRELAESDITPAMLALLSQDPYERVRCTIAAMADLAPEILLHLAQDKSERVQRKLLKNLEISSDFLTLMAQDENLRRRELAAQHQNTPIEWLGILAENPQLQAHIARNPRTPIKILQRLADQGDQDIALTQNPKISDAIVQPILEKLSKSRRYTVRKLVARHPQVPLQILEQLAKDHEPQINQLAQERSQDYLTATNPLTSPDTLWQLLLKYKGKSIQSKAIRRSIACNSNASTKILLELVREFTLEVLDNPVFALLTLEDPQLEFVNQIEESRLVDILNRKNVAQIFINGAINSPYYRVTVALLRIDDLSESYLEKLIHKIKYRYDSELLIKHRNFTPYLKLIVTQYGNEILKDALQKNITSDK